jgi:aldehyde:ferredoxin oxidoreductase
MVGYEEMSEISALIDELGMDGEELGGIVAWAMDLFEHGIITKADLGGIDLKWGNVEATCELLRKIAYKQDRAPAALAEGFRRAYKVFGKDSIPLAMEVHGCAAPTYDVRNQSSYYMGDEVGGLAYSTSHNGARMGAGISSGLSESATFCIFAAIPMFMQFGPPPEVVRRFLNPAAGWELTGDEIKAIALRNYYFNRCISLREGYHPSKDDYLPVRAFEEPITDKYGTTWVWDRDKYEAEKKRHYTQSLALTESGLPPREGLKRMGLEFVIPVLEPVGAVG